MTESVHAYTPFGDSVRRALAEAFPDRPVVCWSRPEEFAAGVEDVRYLLALNPPPGSWARARRLRLLQSFAAGIDHLLPLSDLPPGVAVANAAGLVAEPMSELALGLVLMLHKRLATAVRNQRQHLWQRFVPPRAEGATLAILGLGRIGTALARRAHQQGFRVIGTRHSARPVADVERVYPPGDTPEVLAAADVVVSLLPLTAGTRGLLDEVMLRRMRPGAALINLGRGELLDEHALVELLHEERLSGAALDVFHAEPLPAASPLWDAPNLVITPHIGGAYPGYTADIARLFADNVRRLEAGAPLATPVDPAKGY